MSEDWMTAAAEEIAGDPTCCDLSSSSSFQMLAVIAKHAPAVPRCDQCRCWRRHGSVTPLIETTTGDCRRVDQPGTLVITRFEGSTLETDAAFGCVQFEAKP